MFHIDGMTTWPLRKASRCEVAELEVENSLWWWWWFITQAVQLRDSQKVVHGTDTKR